MSIQPRNTLYIILMILAGVIMDPDIQEEARAELTAKANHDHISINTFYHGSTVSVRGKCDHGTDIIVKISAPEQTTILKQKGKVGGVLWMNTDELEFEHTPGLYLVRSSEKIEDLLEPQEANKYVLGYGALKNHVNIGKITDDNQKDAWFREFIRFNEQKRIYREDNEKIVYSAQRDSRTYYTLFDWPYQAQPGEYEVDVYAARDGKIVDKASSSVLVEQAGTVKFLASTARNKSALYGIISIVVALASGFGTGMIIKSGGGAH